MCGKCMQNRQSTKQDVGNGSMHTWFEDNFFIVVNKISGSEGM